MKKSYADDMQVGKPRLIWAEEFHGGYILNLIVGVGASYSSLIESYCLSCLIVSFLIFFDLGDAAVQRLIDGGVMKQWMQDGVVMCSYRTINVGQEEATVENNTISKAMPTHIWES